MGFNGIRKYLPPIAITRQRMVLAVGANGVYLMQSGEVFEDFKLSFNLSHEEIDGYPFNIIFRRDGNNYEELFWNTHDYMVGFQHYVDGSGQWVGYVEIPISRQANEDLIELIATGNNGILKINGITSMNLPLVHSSGTIELRAATPVTIENLHIEEL